MTKAPVFNFVLATVASLALSTSICYAAPKSGAAKAAAKNVAKAVKKFNRAFDRLSLSDRETLLTYLKANSTFVDSDNDGLPDIAETGSNSNICSTDSDNDGTSDGDEAEQGQDPTGVEIEVKGLITAITDAGVVTVGTTSFSLSDSTTYKRITKTTLAVGVCVEISGHAVTGSTTAAADKVKSDNDCSGQGDDSSDDDSHGGHHGGGDD